MTVTIVRANGVFGHTEADAVTIRDGSIAAIGRAVDLTKLAGANAAVVGQGDGVIAPVLHDHHFHPIGYASAVSGLSLKNAIDFDDMISQLREAADRLGPGEALVANRLDEERMAERRLPSRVELDLAVPDRPVLVYRYCGHVAIANTLALELAGSDGDGILTEDAIRPVSNAVADVQPALSPEAIRRALSGLPSLGLGRLTAIVSTGQPLWCGVSDEVETLLSVAEGLPVEFEVLVIAATAAELESAAARLNSGPSNVSFFGWKEFADGSLGGHTAALYEPYSDDPGNDGISRLDPVHAGQMADVCLGLGGTVAIHAIGDRANDQVLELFEALVKDGADPDRLRIEHASVLTDAAIDRMARLGITASVQPAFLASEGAWLGKRLGSRVDRTYSLAKLAAAGVPLLGGSDCPVEPPNPWGGIAAAAGPGGLEIATAVGLFGQPLEIGGAADFLVIDQDPSTTSDLSSMKVSAFYWRGESIALVDELPFS